MIFDVLFLLAFGFAAGYVVGHRKPTAPPVDIIPPNAAIRDVRGAVASAIAAWNDGLNVGVTVNRPSGMLTDDETSVTLIVAGAARLRRAGYKPDEIDAACMEIMRRM